MVHKNLLVGWGGECVTPVLVRSLECVQTGVHGFDSRTPHKPVVSKTSEADIWLSSYEHLTHILTHVCLH